jgi:hypothetical protein
MQRIRETRETVDKEPLLYKPHKSGVISQKWRIHGHLLEMATADSLPGTYGSLRPQIVPLSASEQSGWFWRQAEREIAMGLHTPGDLYEF